jgi:hypothetical protein
MYIFVSSFSRNGCDTARREERKMDFSIANILEKGAREHSGFSIRIHTQRYLIVVSKFHEESFTRHGWFCSGKSQSVWVGSDCIGGEAAPMDIFGRARMHICLFCIHRCSRHADSGQRALYHKQLVMSAGHNCIHIEAGKRGA